MSIFMVMTESASIGPFDSELDAFLASIDNWQEFNLEGLDETVVMVVACHDGISLVDLTPEVCV